MLHSMWWTHSLNWRRSQGSGFDNSSQGLSLNCNIHRSSFNLIRPLCSAGESDDKFYFIAPFTILFRSRVQNINAISLTKEEVEVDLLILLRPDTPYEFRNHSLNGRLPCNQFTLYSILLNAYNVKKKFKFHFFFKQRKLYCTWYIPVVEITFKVKKWKLCGGHCPLAVQRSNLIFWFFVLVKLNN